MLSADAKTLQSWAEHQLAPELNTWMQDQVLKIQKNAAVHFYSSLSLTARKEHTKLDESPVFQLHNLTWEANSWNTRTLIRAVFCLVAAESLKPEFMEEAFNTADLNESIDLYQILPLFPANKARTLRASEGLRSNAPVVFNAVAHNNPLPLDFAEPAWNQMILKALFISSPLSPIMSLDLRWNENLAHMLSDYADERISANRPVPFELWRCISPYLDERHESMIKSLWNSNDLQEQAALYLCIESSNLAWAKELSATRNLPENISAWNQICPT
jgi:hypothetical protein